MASPSTSTSLLLLISLLSVLPLLSSARPCKTLFVSYTFSSGENAVGTTASSSPVRFFSVYRVVARPVRFVDSDPAEAGARRLGLPRAHRPENPRAAAAAVRISLADSARDILAVLAGLLFGVGCGAITAATLYLAWSLVASHRQICGADDGDDSDGDYGCDAADSPKKVGYVTMVQEPLLASASPAAAEEGYEGK